MSSTRPVAPALRRARQTDDRHPYGVLWLDSYFQEVFLPNGEWQKVALKIYPQLATKIRKQFGHKQRKQMIFELVGPDFVRTYFPDDEYNPEIVEVPNISREERKKLHVDAQNWLQKELAKVATEAGCERPLPGLGHQSEPSPEMMGFLAQSRFLAVKNLDVHLYLQEKEVLRAWESYQAEQSRERDQEKDQLEKIKLRREYERLTGTNPLPRSILRGGSTPYIEKPPPTAMSIFTTASEADHKPTANIKGAMYGATVDPPSFWGMQSNSIGRSVAALLRRDPRRYGEVAARLHGRQLPGTLRTYMWMDVLLKAERERLNDVNAERFVRERFGKAISRGISDLKVKRASHSPISGLIDNAVIEIYDRSPGMRQYLDQNQHMKEAAKALNILYVYDRTYEPYLIYWLFPLQFAFTDFSGQSEHVYDLAMYMDLLNKSCFPNWPQIFAVAERTMARLGEVDREFHDHLETISRINVNINPKEFLVQMIHEEKTKAQALLTSGPSLTRATAASKELLADPRIFLRKWVGEGFASVLDTQAIVYVWDQCFLQHWHSRVLDDFCLALLLLLRSEFLAASDYRQMRRVFLREPCKLYTMDIQHAWVHIQRGGDYHKVPGINRRNQRSRPTTIEPIAPRPFTPPSRVSPAPSTASYRPLPPVGIKHLRLRVDLPSQSATLDPSRVHLVCTVYFGTIQLTTTQSNIASQSPGVQVSKYGARSARIDFPKQSFVFKELDTSQYDLEQEMGGHPYAIVQATMATDTGSVPIGWSRIKLFHSERDPQDQVDSLRSPWVLMEGNYWHTMYNGQAPDQGPRSISGQSARQDSQAVIGNNSQLGALLFDPDNEPQTPEPSPLPQVTPTPTPAPRTATPQKTPVPTPPHSKTPERTKTPVLPGINDTFVLYIDGVDNIPDNATITKVTGRILKTGSLSGLPDLLALPELASRARCPRYTYQLVINDGEVQTDVDMIVLLRVYTVDRITGKLAVIGSCLIQLFDKQTNKLRVGGHQRVLHYGMPDFNQGLGALNHTSLDAGQRIPGCTISYRLTSFTESAYTAPDKFDEETYPLDDARLNESERRVIDSYSRDHRHPNNTEDMARKLLVKEGQTDKSMDLWLADRLDQKAHVAPGQSPAYLPLDTMVQYRQQPGLQILVAKAAGLPEGLYSACLAQVYPGENAQSLPVTAEGYGHNDEKFVALTVDLDSRQAAPQWKDEAKTVHPHCDVHTVLIVQVFGLALKYTATSDHQQPGSLTDPAGGELDLHEDHYIGWSVLPLFSENYTHTGEHHIPLFRGRPDPKMLKEFSVRPADQILQDKDWLKANKLGSASLVIRVWDGHFNDAELLEPLKRKDELLDVVGDKQAYVGVQLDTRGTKLRQIVLDGLASADQAEGTSGQAYITEKEHFTQLVQKTYLALLESSLMEAGQGPL